MWLRGPLANVMNAIAPILNINFRSRSFAFFPWVRYEWVAAAGGVWGTRLPNGSYNGMVGMVERQEVDLALGPFGMTEARAKVKMKAKTGKEFKTTNESNVHLSLRIKITEIIVLVRESMWTLYEILMQQSVPSSRLRVCTVTWLWLVTCLVVMRSYSSGLTSLLAVRRVPVHINSLQDLVRSPGVPMLLEKDTAFTEHINRSQDGIYKEIRDQSTRLKPIKMEDMERVAAATVMEEDAALLVDDLICFALMAGHFKKHGECGMMLADETFWPLQLSIIGQRNSNLVDRISPHIRSLVEQDLYNLWLRRELGDYFSCLHKPKKFTINEPISIRTLWGVMCVLAAGLSVALLVFVAERRVVSVPPCRLSLP
ncbi:uncharacterized protein LOC125178944 [Hyalella azteca]|uniref:Uncharacterized protein LOC125178944 n=1 Tax=Hyalella azteca TaxID=294128 RepID=A0A979FRQ3_HYAAZ|nr:uncharacterized protein LOC125178944 [Hyalella azteca]